MKRRRKRKLNVLSSSPPPSHPPSSHPPSSTSASLNCPSPSCSYTHHKTRAMAAHLRKEHPQLSLTSSQEESLCIRSCPHCHKYYLPGSLPSHKRSCNQKLKKTKAPSPSAPSSSSTSSDPS